MPVAGRRGRGDRVDYIIVERDGVIDSDQDLPVFQLEPSMETEAPAPVQRDAVPTAIAKRVDKDDDNDDDDNDRPPPPPILVTMTRAIPQAQATGGQEPTETVVVALPPPPPPKHDKNGISQTTEHLLIAAGSIGATIIVVMILLGIYHIKKRGLTIAEAMKRTKYSVSRRGPTPPPKRNQWDGTTYNEYEDRKESVTPPPAVARSGSSSSRMPLMATLQRSNSLNTRELSSQRAVSPQNTTGQSFLIDSPVSPQNSHTRNASNALSSPVLPLQNSRESATTRNTQSVSGETLEYPEPPREQRSMSPLPPPPTFRQFLFNRKSVSARPGFGPMVSRFSWTNSNAPQTPHDPYRDTNSHTLGRDSFMTQRSSIPRFRTVDSWVNQQTNRIEEQKLKEQFRFTQSSIATDDDVPDVPEIPKGLAPDDKKPSPLNNVTNAASETTQSQTRSTPPSPPVPISGLPGKNIKHERHDTTTTQDTAPIFRQHPGNEVRFSQRSLVPSEILNSKMRTSVL